LPAKYDDRLARGAETLGDCVQVVDPCGEYKDVGAVAVSGEDVGDDLLEPGVIGDQCAIDFGHSARRGGIGFAGVAEPSAVQVKDRVWCKQTGVC
jgi:hypothetical protein